MDARWIVGQLVLSALLAVAPVRAASPPLPALSPAPPPRAVRLDYSRGPGAERCPGEQAFRDAIGAKVARDLFAADPPPTARLVVKLGRRGAGYEGAAELRDAAGVVTWATVFPHPPHPPAATCVLLIRSLAFSVALEVDQVDPPPVAPPVAPLAPPAVEPPIVPTPAHVEAPRKLLRIGASPWMNYKTAPRLAFGLSLGVGFRVARFSLDLEGHWDPPAAGIINNTSVETSRVAGALVPCGHLANFAGCLLAELDSLRGSVTDVDVNGRKQSVTYRTASGHPKLYPTVGARLSFEVEIAPHLALRPVLDLLLPLNRPALGVVGVSRWEVPAVGVRVGLGLLASF